MKRSKFSLSHYKLATLNMGELIPLTWYDVLPGDTLRQSTAALVRVSPLVAPVMHPVRVRIHHWYVPLRLIWDDFEDFITGGPDGLDATEWPHLDLTGVTVDEGDLLDYLGIPPADYTGVDLDVSALPVRAYNKIFNEFYRDQDLVTELTVDTGNGTDSTSDTDVQHVAWEKDYFTAARPWAQKGDAITIPLTDVAPVQVDVADASAIGIYSTANAAWRRMDSDQTHVDLSTTTASSQANSMYVDLTAVDGVDINDLRLAVALQRYQEARARYGSRYVEYLRYLGVKSSDARLDRPEYLGGGRQVIQFSEVLQTGPDYDSNDGVGQLAGHGISAMRTNRFQKFFEEHGIVMTCMSILPKTIYAQGVHRSWSRETKELYFQRELQHIGEQVVLNKEVYNEHTTLDGTFGFQGRYDEYRSLPSSVCGEFRDVLDEWHMARIFTTDPALNSSFVTAVPTDRIYASSATDQLYVMANHSIQARRILAPRNVPRIM